MSSVPSILFCVLGALMILVGYWEAGTAICLAGFVGAHVIAYLRPDGLRRLRARLEVAERQAQGALALADTACASGAKTAKELSRVIERVRELQLEVASAKDSPPYVA